MSVAPSAFDQPGASIPGLTAGQVDALGLMSRPTLLVPVGSIAASRLLVSGAGILAGYSFREGSSPAANTTFLTASSANAAAANNVTLAAGGGAITNFVTGFAVTGDGATAGSIIAVTLTGVVGGTLTYFVTIPAGAGVAIAPLIVNFTAPGLPASAPNTAITLNVPSFGAGNTNAAASISGYQPPSSGPLTPGSGPLTAVCDLLDGLDAGGEMLVPMQFVPYQVLAQAPGQHGPVFNRGVFVNRIFGTIVGAVYVKI